MEDAYYLSVAFNHAEKVVKSGKTVKIVSKWKGEEDASLCRELVPIKGWKSKRMPKTVIIEGKKHTYTPIPHKECGKPVTHQVTWETPRFYGTKLCVETFCQIHAKKWFAYLNRSKTSTNAEMKPI
jgi:hypothetical protein